MRIFITGIAGFIGFHLAQHLHTLGHAVAGCDNFDPYYSPKLKRQRAQILKEKNISITECDICDSILHNTITTYKPSHLVHLAAQAGVRYAIKNPQAYVHSNLEGFVHIMEICRLFPSMRCIYASSSSVYGLNTKVPFIETDPTDKPSSLYGASKKANELIAHAYHHLYNIPLIGLRFFTVYGPWGRPDMAYFSFTQAISSGTPLPLYGSGESLRDFTYIDDIIQGITSALSVPITYGVFNLGNNKPEKVSTLIHIIEQTLGKKALIEQLPPQPSDVPATWADLTQSQAALNYYPTTSLKAGMGHFLSWYQNSQIYT